MFFRTVWLVGLAAACLPVCARAQEPSEGEQADARIVRPLASLGAATTVQFPIACRSRETQAYFNQAVAALYALDAIAADRSFYQASQLEPDCAMAWWGLAMAHIENRLLARYYLEKAAACAVRGPARERRWVAVLERALQDGASEEDRRNQMVQALSRMTAEDPADHEAVAFLVRQLVSNCEEGMPMPLPAAVDALIGQVLREQPNHPIALYRLVLWEREQPQRVAEMIEPVRRLLPDSARAQTVAGRIYARLHRSAPAIECFTAALALARQTVKAEHVGPLDVPGYVENLDLLIAQLRIEGRVNEAVALARHLIALPSVAPVDENAIPGMGQMGGGGVARAPFASSNADATAVGQRHLLGALIEYQQWDELAAAARSPFLESTHPETQGLRLHAIGLAEFARGDAAGLETQRDALAQLLSGVRTATAGHGLNQQREALLSRLQVLGRELEFCRGLLDRAGVPPGAVPATATAWRTVATYGRAGDVEFALAAARRRAEGPTATASGMLDCVQLLELGGKHEEAKAGLSALRQRFPRSDAGLSGSAATVAGDPDPQRLDRTLDLSPPFAPRWGLPDQHGHRIDASQQQGRPVLLVFYRGAGCPHCIEQLATLAPLNAEFEQAGLALFGVSTDTIAGLQESYSAVGAKTALPFPLLSDDSLAAFRDFRTIDARTGRALHGLFLIDGGGRILWQAISAQPFMAVKSLLAEVRRTLPLWAAPAAVPRHTATASVP